MINDDVDDDGEAVVVGGHIDENSGPGQVIYKVTATDVDTDADDVKFTFELMRDTPGLDGRGLWRDLQEIVVEDDTVRFNFKESTIRYGYCRDLKKYAACTKYLLWNCS